jgi:hypothetical protein
MRWAAQWRRNALPWTPPVSVCRSAMYVPLPLMFTGHRVLARIAFEACSGSTRVTARRIAQPPKATFVTRLQPFRLPQRIGPSFRPSAPDQVRRRLAQ